MDALYIWEDMAYRNGPLISPRLFHEFLVPAGRRITDLSRCYGANLILLDTDGDRSKLISGFLEGA